MSFHITNKNTIPLVHPVLHRRGYAEEAREDDYSRREHGYISHSSHNSGTRLYKSQEKKVTPVERLVLPQFFSPKYVKIVGCMRSANTYAATLEGIKKLIYTTIQSIGVSV